MGGTDHQKQCLQAPPPPFASFAEFFILRLMPDESPGRPNTSTVSAYESQLEISMISANEDDDTEVSLWIDEKEQQRERREVISQAISQLTEGRYSPVASTPNTAWEDVSLTQ